VLESAAVFSPFASYYGISGNWNVIAISYLAHLPYGLAIGICCERPERTVTAMREISPKAPGLVLLGATALGLLAWQQPWSTPSGVSTGERVAAGPSAAIINSRFAPQWIRIAPGRCATVRNDDRVVRVVSGSSVEPGATTSLCVSGDGVHRVKIAGPYSGGFVIVDPEA
jgi:hypothetical protein